MDPEGLIGVGMDALPSHTNVLLIISLNLNGIDIQVDGLGLCTWFVAAGL